MRPVTSTNRKVTLNNQTVVVFSHLRWNFVYQRPQHIISRLARTNRVYFIEEPIGGTVDVVYEDVSGVTVIQPAGNDRTLSLVEGYLQSKGIESNSVSPLLWFYSPGFVDLAEKVRSKLIIYDCMDQLTSFAGASRELAGQENKLLGIADIVFTGGKSLYEEKSRFHPRVFCFPSSVDKTHFAKANATNVSLPQEMLRIPQPRVGFYGVLDERLDRELVAEAADLAPEYSFVLIGPVVKIDESTLPRRNNIYYPGAKGYEELPNYLAGFDVAFMPFALNEATKFISPTKTLEFMAAGRPIVSTGIRDVVRDYNRVVEVVQTAEELRKAVERLIKESPQSKKKRAAEMERIVEKTSWDMTVEKMGQIISNQLAVNKPINAWQVPA